MRGIWETARKSKVFRETGKGLGVLFLLMVLMLWLAGGFVSRVHPGPPSAKPDPGKYDTRKVERGVFPVVVDQVGSVRAQSEAQVSSRIMAQVKEIPVKEGDYVVGYSAEDTAAAVRTAPVEASSQQTGRNLPAGVHPRALKVPTILARLDDREVQARLVQAQQQAAAADRAMETAKARGGAAKAQLDAVMANREKVGADYRRYQDLHSSQAATGQQLAHAKSQKDVAEAQAVAARRDVQAAQSEIERIRAQSEQAEAALAEARVMLSYTVIQAPFSGRVVKKMVEVGDMVAPGRPLFLVDTPGVPELHSYLTESLVPHLKIGQEMEVYVDALKSSFMGSLREVVPKSDPSTRTVLVKVGLPPDFGLVSGLFGRLRVVFGSYESLVVPIKAVREAGQLHLVDILGLDGHPQRRFITIGKRHGDLVEVLSGVNENEDVIIP